LQLLFKHGRSPASRVSAKEIRITATKGTYGNGGSGSPQRPLLGLVDSQMVRLRLDDFPRGIFSSIESSAKIANWKQTNQLQIAILKLSGGAKTFYQGCAEPHTKETNWQTFKEAFRSRYKDVHTDQYHFTRLKTARQEKNESPQQSADRCRELAQKITRKVDDPVAQRVHCENAERMLLASVVSVLNGPDGKHTKYASPSPVHQALQTALAVEQAEKQDRFNESFYTRFEKSVRLTSQSPSSTYAGSSRTRQSADARVSRRTHSQQYKGSKDRVQSPRNAQIREAQKCYECEGVEHIARECPTRLKREAKNADSPRKRDPCEAPSRPRFSGE